MTSLPILTLLLLLPTLGLRAEEAIDDSTPAKAIASLTNPKKLATLKGERAANPRLQKCLYWLASAEARGEKPEAVLDEALQLNRTAGTLYGGFVRWGILENLRLAKEYGILTPQGMAELRQGNSATITMGVYAGQEAEVDYVIPLALPELRNQVFNLELLPTKLKRAKGAKIGERQKVFGKELHDAGLLSDLGLLELSVRSAPEAWQ